LQLGEIEERRRERNQIERDNKRTKAHYTREERERERGGESKKRRQ
jgi:hypothetical protein